MNQENLIFIDFETTGLDPLNERIIQIAAIKINEENEEVFTTYVNPEKNISEFITSLTGIDNKIVSNSPNEKDALKMLVDFIPNEAVIVAQNAPFDLSFLFHGSERANLEINSPSFYCTRTMSAVLFPNLSHKLGDIIELFDIKLENAHDALSDVTATKELFFKLKHIADLHNINFINKLLIDRPLNFEPKNTIKITSSRRK